MTPFEGTSQFRQDVFEFVIEGLGSDSQLMRGSGARGGSGSGLASILRPASSATAINRLMRETESRSSLAIPVIAMPYSRYAMRSASGRSAARLRHSCKVLCDWRCAFETSTAPVANMNCCTSAAYF